MPIVQRSFVENLKFTYRCRFLNNYLSKNPDLKKEDVIQDLDALAKEYGKIRYFARGFVIELGQIFIKGFDFGKLTSLFHIDRPLNLLSVTDSNRAYMQQYDVSENPRIKLSTIFAIHPNIHLDDLADNYPDKGYIEFYNNNPFVLELLGNGTYINGEYEHSADAKYAMMICLGEVKPVYQRYIKAGMFTAAFQTVVSMLNNADNDDCLYHDFNLPCCEYCDQAIEYEDSLKSSNFCPICLPNEKEGSVSMSRCDIEDDDDFEDDDLDDFEDDDFEDEDDELFNFEDDDDFDDDDEDEDFFDDEDDEEDDYL